MAERILIDLLSFTGARGGTETYAREIVSRLPALRSGVHFVAVVGRAGAREVRDFFPGDVHTIRWVGADRVSWALGEMLRVNRLARRVRADLIWSPANFGPVFRGTPRVTTVHDAIYHARGGPIAARMVRRVSATLINRAARTSDAVITVSHSAEEAIVAEIGIDRAAISVIPNGTNRPRSDVASNQPSTVRVPADRSVLLSAGNRQPHKNFDGLLRALACIRPETRPVLVIAGGRADDPLAPMIAKLGLEDDVILPGWVSDAELESLYAAADLYVCPSLIEGFGLPVLDALRRGCPVLANDIPVLREIGGPTTRYTDAADPGAFAAAIEASLAEPQTAVTRDAAREWAATFTWDRSAKETADVLSSVVRARSRP